MRRGYAAGQVRQTPVQPRLLRFAAGERWRGGPRSGHERALLRRIHGGSVCHGTTAMRYGSPRTRARCRGAARRRGGVDSRPASSPKDPTRCNGRRQRPPQARPYFGASQWRCGLIDGRTSRGVGVRRGRPRAAARAGFSPGPDGTGRQSWAIVAAPAATGGGRQAIPPPSRRPAPAPAAAKPRAAAPGGRRRAAGRSGEGDSE